MTPVWWCEACEKYYIHGLGHTCRPIIHTNNSGVIASAFNDDLGALLSSLTERRTKAEQRKDGRERRPTETPNPHNTEASHVGDKQEADIPANPALGSPDVPTVAQDDRFLHQNWDDPWAG